MEAAARPLPSEDTTPPVTKMYFADIFASPNFVGIGWTCRAGTSKYRRFRVGMGRAFRDARRLGGAVPRLGEAGAGGFRAGGGHGPYFIKHVLRRNFS